MLVMPTFLSIHVRRLVLQSAQIMLLVKAYNCRTLSSNDWSDQACVIMSELIKEWKNMDPALHYSNSQAMIWYSRLSCANVKLLSMITLLILAWLLLRSALMMRLPHVFTYLSPASIVNVRFIICLESVTVVPYIFLQTRALALPQTESPALSH